MPDFKFPPRFRDAQTTAEGTHGTIYTAFDTTLGQRVALKIIKSDGDDEARTFYREFRTASSVAHANLVQLYELIDVGSGALLVMEFVEGEDPSSLDWKPGTPLRQFVDGLIAGISWLHGHNLLHGDIKPANIIVHARRGPILVDYGLTRRIPEHREKFFAGTWRYAAPEQFSGIHDTASDWFSLGSVIYESIVGQDPFADEESTQSLMRKMSGTFARDLPEDVPGDIADLVYGLLSHNPQERFASLERYTGTRYTTGAPVPPRGTPGTSAAAIDLLVNATNLHHLHISRLLGGPDLARTEVLKTLENRFDKGVQVIRGRADPREAIPLNLFDAVLENLGVSSRSTSLPDLSDTVARHVAALATAAPTVLILEEVQWADPDSVDLLRRMLLQLERANLHVIVTARSDLWKQSACYSLLNRFNASPDSTQESIQLASHGMDQAMDRNFAHLDHDEERVLGLCAVCAEALSVQEIKACEGFADLNVVLLHFLTHHGFLSIRKHHDALAFEMVSDQVRDRILERTSIEEHKHLNRLLGDLYVARGKDPGITARYYEAAGEHHRAALAAAEAAVTYLERGLAARSVAMHRLALDDAEVAASRGTVLRLSYAKALQRAGLSAEAATILDECARNETGDTNRRLALEAAECYFVCGKIEDGLAISSAMLDQVGIHPELFTDYGEMIAQLSNLTSLSPAPGGPHLREGYDVCWTITKNLVHLQPLLAFSYLVHCIRIALALGDELLRARALAIAAGGVFSGNPAFRRSQETYLELVKEIAESTNDPYLLAVERMWRAYCVFQDGKWMASAHLLRDALKRLRRLPMNTSWEQMTASSLYASCLMHRGLYRFMASFSEKWVINAEASGDLYGQITFRQMKAFYFITTGDTDSARSEIDWMRRNWTRQQTVIHFYLAYFEAYCCLVEGNLDGVDRFITRQLGGFERMGGYQGSTPAMHMLSFEGAYLFHCMGAPRQPVGHAIADLLRLLGEVKRADAPAFNELFRACACLYEGRPAEGLRGLKRAQDLFEQLGMRLYAALVAFQVARLEEPSRAPDMRLLRKLGIPDPLQTASTFVPVPIPRHAGALH